MDNTTKPNELEVFKFPQLVLEQTLYTLNQLKSAAPESAHIALAGRSNVGKSSLINALAKRKQLAKVSSTPGKTRSVNLYRVEPQGFYLTDLPGYGYAKRSKSERELWANLIEKYLVECENLAAIAVLLDCRLEPQEADILMVRFALGHNIPLIPILTKADKCTQKERSDRIAKWSVLIPKGSPLAVSSHTGMGLEKVWKKLIETAMQSPFMQNGAGETAAGQEIGISETAPRENGEAAQEGPMSEKRDGADTADSDAKQSAMLSVPDAEQHAQPNAECAEPDAEQHEKPKKIRTKRGAYAREKEAQKKREQEKARIKAKEEKARAKHKRK